MRRYLAIAALAFLCPTAVLAQGDPPKPDTAKVKAANVAGSWYGTISTPNGNQDFTVTIRKDSSGYSGSMASPQGEVAIYDIRVEGDKVSFGASVPAGGASIDLWYSFVLKDDTMNGQVEGSFNGQSFSLPLVLKKSS